MSSMQTTPNLASLPLDLLLDNLLPSLDIPSLLALSQTCRSFNHLVATDIFWKRRLVTDLHFPIIRTARETGFKDLYRRLVHPEVYTWGSDGHGRLGMSPSDPRLRDVDVQTRGGIDRPARIRGEGPDGKGFVDLQAGGWSFHALDRDGKVWCWGTLNGEIWALQNNGMGESGSTLYEPARLPFSDRLPPMNQLSTGRAHALALSSAGYDGHADTQVFEWRIWGRPCHLTNAPWASGALQQSAIQVSAGWSFSSILCSEGGVWCWWEGEEPEDATVLEERTHGRQPPERLLRVDISRRAVKCPNLSNRQKRANDAKQEKIVKLAAGDDFLIALSNEAKVYRLDVSPLSQGTNNIDPEPRARLEAAFLNQTRRWELLDKFCDVEEILKLDAFHESQTSEHHHRFRAPSTSLRITHVSAHFSKFAVYSVTQRDEESLVLLGQQHSDIPTAIPELQGRGVIDVCLGDYHYGALLASGQLLTWGQHSSGALGLGTSPPPSPPGMPATGLRGTSFPGFHRGRPFALHPPSGHGSHNDPLERPTQVPTFVGAEIGDHAAAGVSTQKLGKRKFVFAASFAGWHSGCLAIGLDADDADENEGWRSQREQGAVPDDDDDTDDDYHSIPGGLPSDDQQAAQPAWRAARGGPPRVRIGYAGRGIRGGFQGTWMQANQTAAERQDHQDQPEADNL